MLKSVYSHSRIECISGRGTLSKVSVCVGIWVGCSLRLCLCLSSYLRLTTENWFCGLGEQVSKIRFFPLDHRIPTRPVGGCHPRVYVVWGVEGGGPLRGVHAFGIGRPIRLLEVLGSHPTNLHTLPSIMNSMHGGTKTKKIDT